ncbi:MAG: element excision factor XisH family protein [Bacteroidota bacterium]
MANDFYHEATKEALIKDGWTITHEQLPLEAGVRDVYVDLAAEKLIIARRGVEKIAVEVKSFVGQSPLTQFADAMGKFDLYSFILRTTLPRRTLFIAMPLPAYDELFDDPFMVEMAKHYSINLIIFEPIEKIIVQWIKN